MELIKTNIELRNWKGRWLRLFENKERLEVPIKVDTQWPCSYDEQSSFLINENCQGFVRKIFNSGRKWFAECELLPSQLIAYCDFNELVLVPYCSYYEQRTTNILYFYPMDK